MCHTVLFDCLPILPVTVSYTNPLPPSSKIKLHNASLPVQRFFVFCFKNQAKEQQVSNIFMNWREAESQLCLKTHSSKLGGRPQDTKAIFDWLEKLTRPEFSHTQDD